MDVLPQPNFGILSRGLRDASDQFALFENLPPFNAAVLQQQMMEQFQLLNRRLDQVDRRLDQVEQSLDRLKFSVNVG